MLDDGPHLRAFRGTRRAQDGHHRRAARHVINMHRREATLVVMRVPERKLLTAMRRAERVVDVEDLYSNLPVVATFLAMLAVWFLFASRLREGQQP
jgi:hypothetical protein